LYARDAAAQRRIEILRADGLRIADHDGLDNGKVYPESPRPVGKPNGVSRE